MTRTSFVFFGISILSACATNSNDTAASNSSALSDTTTESAEIAGSFSSESASGITADLANAAPSGTGASDQLKLAPGTRAELVTALEAIAADPSACTSGTASLTPAGNQTADCTAIGSDGSYPGGVTLAFNSCALANGGILDGAASVTVTRALSAGATCGSGADIDVTHTAVMTNLSYTTPSKYVLTYPSYNAVVTSTHAIDALPTTLTLTSLTGERTVNDPTGKLILDHQFSGSGTVALGASSRTINGTFTVDHELLEVTAMVTVTDLERVETCCKPIDGSVDIALTPDTSQLESGDLTYGPACGDIDLDGNPLRIAECL